MPRKARVQASTNVYHAILRGVNKQQTFEDEDDYIRFLDILRAQTVSKEDPATGEAKQPMTTTLLHASASQPHGARCTRHTWTTANMRNIPSINVHHCGTRTGAAHEVSRVPVPLTLLIKATDFYSTSIHFKPFLSIILS